MKAFNLTKQRFGRLVVIERTGSKKNKATWLCLCDCGNFVIVVGQNLRRGGTKSCGCFQKALVRNRSITHSRTHTKLYTIWIQMRGRCKNKANSSYKNYGGRGITVCKEWEQFENFYFDMGDPPKGLTLERINNDGNYEPSNCKWATRKEQSNNSRKNTIIEYNSQRLTIAEWARKAGLKYNTLLMRLNRNWPIERALIREIKRR